MQHARPLLLASLVVVGCGLTALAQQDSTAAQDSTAIAERVRELQRRVVVDGGDRADQAASDLFLTGVQGRSDLGPEGAHDPFLLGVLADETSKREARQAILRALRTNGRLRAETACRLVLEAMDDPLAAVAQQAVSTFAALDDDRGSVYRWTRNALTVELRRARPDTPRGRQQAALVEALERMPNPIESVGVLVAVLETRGIGIARGLEQRARESLQRLTAQSFEGAQDWHAWYDEAKNLSLAEWRVEVVRRRDERLRRFEGAAERYFSKMLSAYEADPDALRRELQAALTDADTVFGVRRAAIRELGRLGQQQEWAVNLLRSRLTQATSFEYDESRALVIEALGETGSRLVFDDVVQFLPATFHPRMRMAAASALGALQAPRGVDLLLVILDDLTAPDELLEVTVDALGRIKQNPDGKVGAALVRFARGLRPSNGGGGVAQPAATTLLAAVARALGALPYASASDGQPATALLTELAAFDSGNPGADTNVRLAATTALGGVSHPDAFAPLEARLSVETEPKVRRALADAIGQRALDDPTLVPKAMLLLAHLLADGDETMKRKSHVKLEELATRPAGYAESFVGFELLLEALGRAAANRATILSFLGGERGLPPPESLTPAQLQPASRARYFTLLAARARAQLETAPDAALTDFLVAIEGLQLGAPASAPARALHLGKARALLRVTPARPRDALNVLVPCLQAQPSPEEVAELWPVTLEAAEKTKAADPAALNGAWPSLQGLASLGLPGTPPDVKDRLAALKP